MRSHHDFCAAIERANLPLEQRGHDGGSCERPSEHNA